MRHTNPRALARAIESQSRRAIAKASRGLIAQRKITREDWDTSSEWLENVRGAIRVAEEALGVRHRAR